MSAGARDTGNARETLRITLSLAVVCAVGAGVLGGLYAVTERWQRAASERRERAAVTGMLGLPVSAPLLEVRQYLAPAAGAVVYRAQRPDAPSAAREFAFTLDGAPAPLPPGEGRVPLGRLFVGERQGAGRGDAPVGFVVEGITRGYKSPMRFLVALDAAGAVLGVRVIEHEEDPGLGAEVATPLFQAQFVGRDSAALARLAVTKDPMPEDWRTALGELQRMPAGTWQARHAALAARERSRPIYAVTGATISSRALTDGVRATIEHFRRRWLLIAPNLAGAA